MNTVSLLYFILGVSLLLWPLATIFFKRQVLGAQWMQMLALIFTGLSIIVYSCLFNSFLNDEYLLVLIWMALALFAPPTAGIAMAALTRQGGVSRKVRIHYIIAASVMLLVILSVFVGGKSMYLIWIGRSADGGTHIFYPGSWRYNLIVAIHHYLFNFTLVGELLFTAVYSYIRLRKLHVILGEYYANSTVRTHSIRASHTCIIALCLMVATTVLVFPFNEFRPVGFVSVTCSIAGLAGLLLGGISYFSNYGVERFNREHTIHRSGGDPARLGRTMCEYIEKEGFRNPDLTVFDLATHFRLSQDDVVDIIHRMHGMTFSRYVDSLRVEQANSIIMSENPNLNDAETMSRLAHRCGYSNGDDLRRAMQVLLPQ